jgi:hypothetical protein
MGEGKHDLINMALVGLVFTFLQLWIHSRYSGLYDKIKDLKENLEKEIADIKDDIKAIKKRLRI